MRYFIFFIFLFTVLVPAMYAEEDQKTEEIKSLTEERRDILRFGIDTQILEVLDKLEDEKDDTLAEESLEIFRSTLTTKVKLAVLSYFTAVDYKDASGEVLDYLETYEEEELPADIIAASLRYISDSAEARKGASMDLFMELCGHDDDVVARAAIEAVGTCEEDRCITFLLGLYEDNDTSNNRREIILSALGKMGAKEALPMLEEILEDPDEERSLRWKACQALGDIGDASSLPALRQALGSDDTYLRSYAVGALTSFEGKEVENLLIEALKDSFWRVRTRAAEALGERASEASVPILLFKAEKDPETNVRMAALKALADIGTGDALEYIRNIFEKKTTSPALRVEAARILVEQDLDTSLDRVEKVLSEAWEARNASFRNALGNFLSLQEHKGLEPIFEKMLGHPDIPMRLYAIRGIGRNRFNGLKTRLEELSEEGNPTSIRKEALAALEKI